MPEMKSVPVDQQNEFPCENEAFRLESLKSYRILYTGREAFFDDIVSLAASTFHAPISLITLFNDDKQWFKAKVGVQSDQIRADLPLFSPSIIGHDVLVVSDLASDNRFKNLPFVGGAPYVRFYAGAPIKSSEGCVIGTVSVLDFQPREFGLAQQDVLNLLARLTMDQIELRRNHGDTTRLAADLQSSHTLLTVTSAELEQCVVQRNKSLAVSENRFRTVVESLEEAILIADVEGVIKYSNARITDLTGFSLEQITGKNIFEIFLKPDEWNLHCLSKTYGIRSEVQTWETAITKASGVDFWAEVKIQPYVDEVNLLTGVLCSIMDISERHQFQKELSRQAYNDGLTGLPNSAFLIQQLELALANALKIDVRIGLLFVDLDNFKLVNDTLGHAIGDDFLRDVAIRLTKFVDPRHIVARLGGDEFVIMLRDLADTQSMLAVAERVAAALKDVFLVRGREIFTSASIGGTISTPGLNNSKGLLRQADVAMYKVKTMGKASYVLFDIEMEKQANERLELEAALRQAIFNDELCLHYQPIIDLQTGRIMEVEALVRWNHPKLGLLGPGKFIQIAEESGLIVQLGRWVMEHACAKARQWMDALPNQQPVTICVNISSRQFHLDQLLDEIKSVLGHTNLPSNLLKLEITESLLMDNIGTIEKLTSIQALGVHLAVDDFGSGYSSMSYLSRFPVNTLKVDQSFISQLAVSADASAIIEAIIMLGKALRMKVTCEGIETGYQHNLLSALGSDFGQGFYYSRPVTADQMLLLLSQQVDGSPHWADTFVLAA